jgi:hypothetical protein
VNGVSLEAGVDDRDVQDMTLRPVRVNGSIGLPSD